MEQLSTICDGNGRDCEGLTPMGSRSLRRIIRPVFGHHAGCPILAKLGWAYSAGPKGHPVSGESRIPRGLRAVPRVVESSALYSGT